MTLTTTPHSMQQLMAVWNHRLNNDPEGPTFISNTALQSNDSNSYIGTSQSHSGHTVVATQAAEILLAGRPFGMGDGVVDVAHLGPPGTPREHAAVVPGADEVGQPCGGPVGGSPIVQQHTRYRVGE